MHKVKILHCADIHIGASVSYLGTSAAKRRAETLLTFERIINAARENTVELLLIAGDLFDSNKIDSSLIDGVFEAIESLSPTPVVVAVGNHDPLTSDSPFITRKLPNNLHVLGTEDECFTLEKLGVRIYGKSFAGMYMQGKSSFSLTPPNDDIINIMLLHGDTSGDQSSDYNGISSGFMASSGMDYIALGHIHKRSDILKSGSSFYAYSGCPEGQGFDELGPKGVYIGSIGKGICELEFTPVCKRMHLELAVDISEIPSQEIYRHITSKMQEIESYSEHLYKIILTGSIPENTNLLLDELKSRLESEVFFVKIKDKTTVTVDFETIAKEKSLKGIFVRKMLEKLNTASPEEVESLKNALDIGLRAFYSEVNYRDDK